MTSCNNCKKVEDVDDALKQCAVCGTVKYCSTDCQKQHWAVHKSSCTTAGCLKLFAAIQDNDRKTVERLAKTKRILNGRVDYTPPPEPAFPNPHVMGKWTGLHQCVRLENVEMMQILIDSNGGGINLEVKDVDEETPAFVAASQKCPAIMKTLLKGGANPNAMAGDGWTCLMMSVRIGDYETTKALLEGGADLNLGRDMYGRTAIDISSETVSGRMGLRTTTDEPHEAAVARHKRVNNLLLELAARRG